MCGQRRERAGIAAAIAAQTALWPRAPLGGDLLVDPTVAVLDEYFVALQTHLRFLPVRNTPTGTLEWPCSKLDIHNDD